MDILAVGSEKTIREVCGKNNISLDRISIIDVEKVMPVEVDAAEVVKSYDDSTLAVGLKMLANREGAFTPPKASTIILILPIPPVPVKPVSMLKARVPQSAGNPTPA